MKVKTALILCAGLGKRLKPLTFKQPKPLLKLNNITLLENTINLIKELGIKKILLNTYHLKNKIKNYLNDNKFDVSIDIIDDGEQVLDTGGGIMNMINSTNEKNFLILNPVVNKKLSFDKQLSGDFNLQNNQLTKNTNNEYIYTGCQIFSRDLLNFNTKKVFSITEIWDALIEKNNLFGYESKNKFSHVTNLEIYNKLLKDY